jgi:cysteine desulfurase/selenocysteine lyase
MSTIGAESVGPSSVEEIRGDFPVADTCAYLDNAYVGPLPSCGFTAMSGYLERWHRQAYADGRFPEWMAHAEQVRAKVGQLLGASSDEIFSSRSTTDGLISAANGLLRPGDHLLLGGLDHPADYAAWLQLRPRGIDVTVVRNRGGRMLVDDFATALTPRTRAIGVCLVNTYNGHRLDLAGLSELCRQEQVHLLVDGIQTVGCVDLNLGQFGVSVLSAGAYKWLCSPHGLGITYVNRRLAGTLAPASAWWPNVRPAGQDDWGGYIRQLVADGDEAIAASSPLPKLTFADGARQLESSLNFLSLYGLEAVVDLFLRVGMANVERRVLGLTDYLCEQVRTVGGEVLSPRDAHERSGIVSVGVPDAAGFAQLCAERKIHVLPQHRVGRGSGYARAIRVSPHCYNNEADIDTFAAALRSHLSPVASR